jgi:hypothetical protein
VDLDRETSDRVSTGPTARQAFDSPTVDAGSPTPRYPQNPFMHVPEVQTFPVQHASPVFPHIWQKPNEHPRPVSHVFPAQHVSPTVPHAPHMPAAVHIPDVHVFPAQQVSFMPPHGSQTSPPTPIAQARPLEHVSPAQHGCVAPPQAAHIPF